MSNPKTFCLQINSLCQTKTATKNKRTENLGMILKAVAEKCKQPTVNQQTATKTKNHFALRYKMKTALQKTYEPTATEKSNGFKTCPNPQQQNFNELKI